MPLHVLRTLAFNRAAHSSTSGTTRILYPMPASRTKHALTSTIASQADTLNSPLWPSQPGRLPAPALRPAHLVELSNAKAAEGLSGSSVRHIHAVIRRALNVAVKWRLISVNPATLVDAPKVAQHDFTPLSAAQARELIRAAGDDRMAARWLVGLALGLRQGESLGLWWRT